MSINSRTRISIIEPAPMTSDDQAYLVEISQRLNKLRALVDKQSPQPELENLSV